MRRLEAGVLAAGFLLICAALAAVDWRLGMGAAGLFLVFASIDMPRVRR